MPSGKRLAAPHGCAEVAVSRRRPSPQHRLCPGTGQLQGASCNLWPSIQRKCLRQPGTFLFFGDRRELEKKQERNINLQSSGTPQIPVSRTGGATAPFQSARAIREQQRGLCPPRLTELQFEVAAMGLSSSRSMLELVGRRLL